MLMEWKISVIQGEFRRRYKRFFADVDVDGEAVVAHVPNTGSLKTCIETPRAALLSPAVNPERKLKYTLEAVRGEEGWIGVNTSWPNVLVTEAFENKLIADWAEFTEFKREVKISPETRLDGLLTAADGRRRYIEVKNVTYNDRGVAKFPDGVTARGLKHLSELMKLVDQGFEAEIVFVIQRLDCRRFSAAQDIDPEYARGLERALKAGVRPRLLGVDVSTRGLELRPDHYTFEM